jgi:hypothetical protein
MEEKPLPAPVDALTPQGEPLEVPQPNSGIAAMLKTLNRRQRRAYFAGRRSGMDEQQALRSIRARR